MFLELRDIDGNIVDLWPEHISCIISHPGMKGRVTTTTVVMGGYEIVFEMSREDLLKKIHDFWELPRAIPPNTFAGEPQGEGDDPS